ncbi:MAG: SDR family oxidoreductase [Candidatus Margulisbacteria bacterium]|nr:SDR family oxidoreductase [Candidatus Margulisiibacteriota bacterium]
MAKFLITGGAGFIGSNIVRKLVDLNENVTVVDDLSTGRKENIEPFLNKIKFIKGDLANLKIAYKVTKNIDYVIHQAAIPSVPRSVDNPLDTNKANITGTLNILIAARDNKVKRLVYASSSSIYGDQNPDQAKVETMPAKPKTPYGLQKYTGETYCRLFYELYGLETVSLRYFNVFGPNQDPTSEYAAVIPKFIKTILKDKTPIIYGDGNTSRDFTFVENNVQANILAATSKNGAGEILNIATGQSISLLELVEKINNLTGKHIKATHEAERPGDIKHSLANISKANDILSYQPQISFEEGLKQTIQFYK